MIRAGLFNNCFSYGAAAEIGKRRKENQDEVICCPEYGFFAVSDGIGGIYGGGETSALIAKSLPLLIGPAASELEKNPLPERAADLLAGVVCQLSDSIYEGFNRGLRPAYGATLCGVWLIGSHAVFVNIGDSRGYRLGFYKRKAIQETEDHNVAALLVASGELTREEARTHKSKSTLTRFAGMASPALPETYTVKVERGDIILLCSDGLYEMLEDRKIAKLLRSSKNRQRVAGRLVDEANLAGGKDNISVVNIKIGKRWSGD
jgi:protein phosphatase